MDEIIKRFLDEINKELQLAEFSKANSQNISKKSEEELRYKMRLIFDNLEVLSGGLREDIDFNDDAAKFLLEVCDGMSYAPLRILFKGLHTVRSKYLNNKRSIIYEFWTAPNRLNEIALLYLVDTGDSKLRLFTIETSDPYPNNFPTYMLCEYAGNNIEYRHINYGETNLDEVSIKIKEILLEAKI